MSNKRVKELMQENPSMISPEATLQEAAQRMKEIDCGALPVGKGDKVEGVITDRDIVIRAVANGVDVAQEKVRKFMTGNVHFVDNNESTDNAATVMREKGINRVMVKDENGKPCGILTFGRLIRNNKSKQEIIDVIECAVGKKAA